MYVLQQPIKWKEYIHLVEFAYNNAYHALFKIIPFEVLYGRKCQIPVNWNSPKDKFMLGPDMQKDVETTVKRVWSNLKTVQDWQKIYANRKRSYQGFQVGDHVYLRVKPKISTLLWSGCSKLGPRFCRPFQIIVRIGLVVYQLDLVGNICVHNIFHVSLLKKYIHDPNHIIQWKDI